MTSLLRIFLETPNNDNDLEALLGWLLQSEKQEDIRSLVSEEALSRLCKMAILNVYKATSMLSRDISWKNLLTSGEIRDSASELEENPALDLYTASILEILSALLHGKE